MKQVKVEVKWFKLHQQQIKEASLPFEKTEERILKSIEETLATIDVLITSNNDHIKILQASDNKRNAWRRKALEIAVEKLKIHKNRKLKEYKRMVSNSKNHSFARMANSISYGYNSIQDYDIFFLTPTFILEDILWVYGPTLRDVIEISLGRENKISLEKYLPTLITHITEDVLPYLSDKKEFRQRSILISEAMLAAESGFVNAANVLLMTSIEGVVRILAQHVLDAQGLQVKQYEFSSLENLITLNHRDKNRKSALQWKDEIFNDKESLYHYQRSIGEPFKNILLKHEIDEVVHIKTFTNFSERFEFLVNSYKEERNIIIHGNKENFDEKWRYYLLLSAVSKTHNEIKHYYDNK